MRRLQRFLARLLNSALRRRDAKLLQEEIEAHLALQTADNLRAGLSPSEAQRQALLKFGAVEAMQERYWAEGGLAFARLVQVQLKWAHSSGGLEAGEPIWSF